MVEDSIDFKTTTDCMLLPHHILTSLAGVWEILKKKSFSMSFSETRQCLVQQKADLASMCQCWSCWLIPTLGLSMLDVTFEKHVVGFIGISTKVYAYTEEGTKRITAFLDTKMQELWQGLEKLHKEVNSQQNRVKCYLEGYLVYPDTIQKCVEELKVVFFRTCAQPCRGGEFGKNK